MQIHIIAVGTRMPAWVEAGYGEYAKRMPRECRLVLREIPAGRRAKGADIARLVREEGARQLAAVPAGARVVALERTGRELDTGGLAAALERQLASGTDLALLIGGPEGLSEECRKRADETWSLSKLTLAHPVARVVVAEQIYRAWSIIKGLPYHR
ncbi:MAG: 23S rRNA (pseudouridine(1915)-N(3))-methyltransferase RlmH [Candidatus Muproteobacteria bacterium RBG_16_65_31]|uniref:Ribosomal RNA large subunit methyltransferase H n=1 Tax=Candidatus Muproteobacteria bacterium RBG_16_65_31 TaxID=1817759 RepID=A0A1F6TED2_9PROT|nr:MAG: 23S rRNA (pseudouridine(1915)-N(3))-methyltransferase RlmH [Candidatus Muproteobacteria bacterium RBG_16_65_31]